MSTASDTSIVKTFTDANFDSVALQAKTPVLVDFWASWCAPCMSIIPVLDTLAADYKDRLLVGKLNVDENANTPATYGVRSIPYFILLKDGEVIDTMVGASKQKLTSMVEKHLS